MDEVKVGVKYGYVIRKMFEIWSYQVTQYDPTTREGGLFHRYIDKLFIEKTYASGYPPECNDDTSRERHLAEFERQEDVKLDREKIAFNAGKRAVTKSCLNSLWGKFGQRENMSKTEVVTDPQRLNDLLSEADVEVNSVLPVDNTTLYANWCYRDESVEPSSLVNVVVAAYTTALAHLKLLSELMPLGERFLYHDTDSIVYVSREGITSLRSARS